MRPFLGFPELWNDGLHSRKNKKKDPFCPIKKKKPVVVSDILFHRPALRRPASFAAPVGSRFFNCPSTALYCLHAARSGYSGRLDCNKKGNIYLSGGKQESEATLEMCDASLCLVSSQAMASLGPHRGKADGSYRTRTFPVLRFVKSSCVSMCSFISRPPAKTERHHHVARSEDGRLFYDSQWYCRGQAICINRKDEFPTRFVCGRVGSLGISPIL